MAQGRLRSVWEQTERSYHWHGWVVPQNSHCGPSHHELLWGFWPLVLDWWVSEELDLGNLSPARSLHSQDDVQHLHWETWEENWSHLWFVLDLHKDQKVFLGKPLMETFSVQIHGWQQCEGWTPSSWQLFAGDQELIFHCCDCDLLQAFKKQVVTLSSWNAMDNIGTPLLGLSLLVFLYLCSDFLCISLWGTSLGHFVEFLLTQVDREDDGHTIGKAVWDRDVTKELSSLLFLEKGQVWHQLHRSQNMFAQLRGRRTQLGCYQILNSHVVFPAWELPPGAAGAAECSSLSSSFM